jgi:transcriptional regulator with XRE-family HTH domain
MPNGEKPELRFRAPCDWMRQGADDFGVLERPEWHLPTSAFELAHLRGAQFQHRASIEIRDGKRGLGIRNPELAEITGIPRNTISRYLCGRSRIDLIAMQVLLEAVGKTALLRFGVPAKSFGDLQSEGRLAPARADAPATFQRTPGHRQ